MSNPVFKILIDDERVTGEYGEPGVQPEPEGYADLVLDQLTLDTVVLMNRWLSFWDLIQGSGIRRKETLLEPSTLEVLGKQLWRLVLDNNVGNALKAKIPEAGMPPIRLSIEFDDNANATLKGLPWEFLFEPEHGWFLATKTELSLTRYVSVPNAWDTIGQVSGRAKLRALLIAALPDDRKFAFHREALGKLRTALADVKNLEVAEPISVWDPARITKALTDTEYHIVHVVGICRGVPGQPQIYLGGMGDGFEDPSVFVECLTANTVRPRLIILQLCDYEDGDATENFERLAPELIKHQVPAVLALQYAAGVDQADRIGLGKDFYKSLVDGERIGAAVQASRARLSQHRDRRFGTPVLYLQEDGALRRPGSAIAIDESTARTGTSRGLTVRSLLSDLVVEQQLEGELEWSLLEWVAGLDEQIGPAAVKVQLKRRMLSSRDATERGALARLVVELGRLAGGDVGS